MYVKPANKFVFNFIGLSNFLEVEIDGGAVYLAGVREAGPLTVNVPPPQTSGKPPTMACRPGEIGIVQDGGVRGVICRRTLLGDTIDYRVKVGTQEIRVQQNVRKPLFEEGQICGLIFPQVHWYAD